MCVLPGVRVLLEQAVMEVWEEGGPWVSRDEQGPWLLGPKGVSSGSRGVMWSW